MARRNSTRFDVGAHLPHVERAKNTVRIIILFIFFCALVEREPRRADVLLRKLHEFSRCRPDLFNYLTYWAEEMGTKAGFPFI